jgi:ribonucleoside-diphosphate reductase alpha chain
MELSANKVGDLKDLSANKDGDLMELSANKVGDLMELSSNARTVLERRYLRKEGEKVCETPEDLLRRVADSIAGIEVKAFEATKAEVAEIAEKFFQLMKQKKFMPNSPTLMNAGCELGQLSACFVLPVEDSMESIFESLKISALIHKSGGGTGFSFSRIRPKNDQVGSTGGVASGPLSFLKVFNASTEAVKQGGTRRGANMGILRVDHPDILEFIAAKHNKGEISNFNLSVALTDVFMKALDQGEDYFLINPHTNQPTAKLPARQVFDQIVRSAWESGDPGIIFIDRINEANPTPQVGALESTNPCGEQPLLPYESCNLGSINLIKMVRLQKGSSEWELDWEELGRVTSLAVRFLDDVIEANRFPIPQIEQQTKANRKIGLGLMGWADLLMKLKISYRSEAALQLAGQIMQFIDHKSKLASVELAKARGTFPNFQGSIYDGPNPTPVRNATTTTIAPTGTISIICDTSGGIEPVFSLAFTRQIMDNDRLIEVNPVFAEIAKEHGFYSQELLETIAACGSAQGVTAIPQEWRDVLVTAHDIEPEWHIRMQAAFQKYTDNAVSKTINFPHDATAAQVAEAYRLAYRLGCKGITVYRDGSLDNQPMQLGLDQAGQPQTTTPAVTNQPLSYGEWGHLLPIKRPKRLAGITDARQTPEGNLYLTLNLHEGCPLELFAQIGKAGSDISAFTEAIARLISLTFRCGIDPEAVADELIGIGGSRFVGFGPNRVRSVPDAIGQFLQENLAKLNQEQAVGEVQPQLELGLVTTAITSEPVLTPPEANKVKGKVRYNLCPACGMHTFGYVEGCAKCIACGHSEC